MKKCHSISSLVRLVGARSARRLVFLAVPPCHISSSPRTPLLTSSLSLSCIIIDQYIHMMYQHIGQFLVSSLSSSQHINHHCDLNYLELNFLLIIFSFMDVRQSNTGKLSIKESTLSASHINFLITFTHLFQNQILSQHHHSHNHQLMH